MKEITITREQFMEMAESVSKEVLADDHKRMEEQGIDMMGHLLIGMINTINHVQFAGKLADMLFGPEESDDNGVEV